MDPIAQMQAQIAALTRQVGELMEYKAARQEQQISYPVDDASLNTLGAYHRIGLGQTSPTHTITIPVGGGSATVPTNPVGSVIMMAQGERVEVPVLSFV